MATKSSHSKLQWPRSDGDKSRWPTDLTPGGRSWHVMPPKDHQKWKLYQTKVGQHLAEKFGIPGKNHWIDMPEGYYIFIHNKPQEKDGVVREDTYMYGSTSLLPSQRFRSPQEFMPHAEWLFDTSKPLHDHTQCGCKYNSSSKIALEKKSASAANALKRPKSDAPYAKRPRTDDPLDTIVAERAIDARSQRRYRKGELIWFKIDPIKPPKGSSLPEITHWPGLIASLTEKSEEDGGSANASLALAWSSAGGVAPAHLRRNRRHWEHSIRPLGMFSNSYEVKRGVNDLLPWSAGPELLGGHHGWAKLFEEGDRVLLEGAAKEVKTDPPKNKDELTGPALEERWKRRWGERKRFGDLGQNWDMATLRLSVAIKTAESIATSWSQTDKIDVLPAGSTLTPEEVEALENRRKILFQGMWYQGERIWLEDMVRLRKRRADLPAQLRGTASPGAEERALFLLIRLIALEAFAEEGLDRDAWRCILYGDLYELAPRDYVDPDPSSSPAPESMRDIKALPGYKYRRLNPEGSEVTVDVFDLAGRVYPDLLASGWFSADPAPDKVTAGENTLSLTGQRAVTAPPPADFTWKGDPTLVDVMADKTEDLYVIVSDATKGLEARTRERYAGELARAMGWPEPKVEPKVEVKAQNGH